MKNKIFTTILLAIIIIFSIQLSAQATVISTDKQVESGSGTVTISVTAKQTLGAYTLKLTDTAGLTLVSAAGGEVSSDKKTITGSSAEGTKNLGAYTFNVPTVEQDTKYNIKFSITGMETPSLEAIPNETNTAVLTVKAPVAVTPEPTPTPEPETQTTPKELEFTTVNETVYIKSTVNVRGKASDTAKILGQLKEGDSVTRIGISKTVDEKKYSWSKITFNGQTAYVISSKLTTEKPTEEEPETPAEETTPEEPTEIATNINDGITEGLKSLEIKGVTLSPAFSPDVYEYRIIVKEDISELEINAVPVSEGATVTIAGDKGLSEGENLIIIVVYNSNDEVEATYQITANKNTLDLSKTDEILSLGTKEARRNLIIFVAVFVVAIIALVVVLILKRRNEYYDEDEEYDEEYGSDDEESAQRGEEYTNSEQTVENLTSEDMQERTTQTEIEQEEKNMPRRDKRKGKHF